MISMEVLCSMFSEEVKQVVYLSVTCVLLAMVLTFASSLMSVKNDMVDTRNVEINTGAQVREAKQFAKYNDANLTGIDVIEAISEYKTDDTVVVIVKQGNFKMYSKKNYAHHKANYDIEKLQDTFTQSGVNSRYHAKLLTGLSTVCDESLADISGTLSNDLSNFIAGRSSGLDKLTYSADGSNIKAIVFYPY